MGRIVTLVLFCSLLPATAHSADFAYSSEDIVRGLTAQPDRSETRGFGTSRGIGKGLDLTRAAPAMREVVSMHESTKGIVITRGFEAVERESGSVNLKVEFDIDSAQLRPAARQVMEQLANALARPELQGKNIGINGHTDSDGSNQHNLDLSFRRARSVRGYLVSRYDIPASRLKVVGYGESMPIVANTSYANKQLNRRVELRLLP